MRESVSVVLSGEAGQGLQTVESFLVRASARFYHVYSTTELMSRVRGGNNSVEIRISARPLHAYTESVDICVILDRKGLVRMRDRISPQTVLIGDEGIMEKCKEAPTCVKKNVPLSALAKEAGSVLYINVIVFGMVAGILGLERDTCISLIGEKFSNKGDDVIRSNTDAFDTGRKHGEKLGIDIDIEKVPNTGDYVIRNGSEAVAIGALAGGCDFISSYPMSPATGVFQYLAARAGDLSLVVEQAEDEISAVNMAVGAWYAGARAMVSTSGGGFSLMQEGLSLAGMTETPLVIHLGQRPGPATGMPTRTEQSCLLFAVYGGHGEFPRVVLAPGTPEDAMLLTQKAFYLADRFQIPVIILTDQHLLDSSCMMRPVSFHQKYMVRAIVESSLEYTRYARTETGISPRSVPGYGEGVVCCDSDEHDEYGRITEDFGVRAAMNAKRLVKAESVIMECSSGTLVGAEA